MGYSRGIRGVFTEYSYVSVMCRLCIGYVSVIYRNKHGEGGFLLVLIQISCNFDTSKLERNRGIPIELER